MARSPRGREAILAAARHEFATKGYDRTSIRDIAQSAGLSLSALYYYFPSKHDALFELIRSAFEEYIAQSRGVVDLAGPDARCQLTALVRHLVDYRISHIQQSHLLLRETSSLGAEEFAIIREMQVASNDIFHGVVSLGVAQGHFETLRPRDVTRAVVSMCNQISSWYRLDGSLSVADVQERYVRFADLLVETRRDTEALADTAQVAASKLV